MEPRASPARVGGRRLRQCEEDCDPGPHQSRKRDRGNSACATDRSAARVCGSLSWRRFAAGLRRPAANDRGSISNILVYAAPSRAPSGHEKAYRLIQSLGGGGYAAVRPNRPLSQATDHRSPATGSGDRPSQCHSGVATVRVHQDIGIDRDHSPRPS